MSCAAFISRSPRLTLPLLLVAAALATGCVAYRPELRRTPERASSAVAPPTGGLTFERALALLVERNPELRALEAEARGVNLRPNEAALAGGLEAGEDGVTTATVATDLLALLGVGPRPARAALARALRSEVFARQSARARELTRELATAYARLAELEALATSAPALDARAYARAGLVAPADLLESGSAGTGWAAERDIVALEARRQRLAIARLVGAGPEHELRPVLAPSGWPALPQPIALALLYARADLQRLAAAVEVADREARLAVTRQWPNLGVGLGSTFDPTDPFGALEVSLPLGAPAEARAAFARRDAAVLALEAGVLAARHEAAERRLAFAQAEADLRYRQAGWIAKRALAFAARQRALIDVNDLPLAVRAQGEELEAARDLREARLARADARVEAAVAAGWPGPQANLVAAEAPRAGRMWGSE